MSGLRYAINGEINNPGMGVLYQDRATIMVPLQIRVILQRQVLKEVNYQKVCTWFYETYSIDLTSENAMKSTLLLHSTK